MNRKWTREERKKHLKEKFKSKKERAFAIIIVAAIFVALICLLFYGIRAGADSYLLIILAIIILILIPVSVFFIDTLTWEMCN